MTTPMSLERFEALAEAYGGAVARWPETERDAAFAMAPDPAARAILVRSTALDDVLDAWPVPAPSARLRAAVSPRVTHPSTARRVRWWWSGVGIAAALAGATVGVAAVTMLAPIDATSDGATSFGDLGAQES